MSEFGRVIAFVPVREGSKGLPGKNLRVLEGVPLYERAVAQGLRVVGSCVVSTDIRQVLDKPPPEGCVIVSRPEELCADDVPMDAVINHLIESLDLEAEVKIVLLQATSPLRSDADVSSAIALHAQNGHDLVMSLTRSDPSILKYGMLEGVDYTPLASPKYCFANRQDLPTVFRPNGAIFVFSVGAFRQNKGLATQKIGAIEMPADRSVDIDSLTDFEHVAARLALE